MAEKLEFDLTVKSNTLKAGLEDAISKSGKLEGALNTALGVFGGGLAIKAVKSFGEAIGSAVDFAKESVKAFSEQEDAINRLGQSLKASGEFSNTAIDDFSKFASELQRTSKFGDEVVLSQLALAKSFGASNAEAKSLVTAAANLSATFGGSLEENLEKLGKTLSGTAGRLSQFIPELKSLTEEQLRSAGAADIVNSKFNGAASAELKTYSGSVAANANAFSDLQEEIGALLAKNALTRGSVSLATSAFQSATEAVKAFNAAIGIGLTPAQEQNKELNELGKEYNRLQGIVESTKKSIEFSQKSGSDELSNVKRIQELQAKIVIAEGMQNDILIKRKEIRASLAEDKAKVEVNKPEGDTNDQAILDRRQALSDQIITIKQQSAIESSKVDDQLALESQSRDLANQATTLELQAAYETSKSDLIYQAELDRNSLIKDAKERALADQKSLADKEFRQIGIDNAKKRGQADGQLAFDKAVVAKKQDLLISSLSTAANIAKEGTAVQFVLQKAAAIAQIAISRSQALALVPAQTALIPYPANLAAIAQMTALINAQAAVGLAGVVGTSLKFEQGGFVGGMNGASIGPDNKIASVREGEMILNAEDQLVVLKALKSGSFGNGGDIVIQVDGREIARAVRNQTKQGFRL